MMYHNHRAPSQPISIENSVPLEDLEKVVNFLGPDVIVDVGASLTGGKSKLCRGIELHKRAKLARECRIVVDCKTPRSGVIIGQEVVCEPGVFIEGTGGVEIGAGTTIGANASIHSSVTGTSSGVHIGKNVKIGSDVVIKAGVSIGELAVIEAGSIVTKSVLPGGIFSSNPAPVCPSSFQPGFPVKHGSLTRI